MTACHKAIVYWDGGLTVKPEPTEQTYRNALLRMGRWFGCVCVVEHADKVGACWERLVGHTAYFDAWRPGVHDYRGV